MNIINLSLGSWIGQGSLECPTIPFHDLWEMHPPEFDQVVMFDKIINTPRWSQTYGRDYWYSGLLHKAQPVPAILEPLHAWANEKAGVIFDQVLVNWYMDGSHYIGPHSDNERHIERGSPILAVLCSISRCMIIHM